MADGLAAGDERAVAELFDRYYDRLYRLLYYRLGGNSYDAEDALQETLIARDLDREVLERLHPFVPMTLATRCSNYLAFPFASRASGYVDKGTKHGLTNPTNLSLTVTLGAANRLCAGFRPDTPAVGARLQPWDLDLLLATEYGLLEI